MLCKILNPKGLGVNILNTQDLGLIRGWCPTPAYTLAMIFCFICAVKVGCHSTA